jgi:hypothetical protein
MALQIDSSLLLALAIALVCSSSLAQGQGIKGGSSLNALTNNQAATSNQLTSSFVQMFNSLTPSEQQQFIKQMSSSNRKIFQQAVQQQQPQHHQSFFHQVQRVQQVAQPVVLPTSEQSFRRVQSFSSQPLPVQQQQQQQQQEFTSVQQVKAAQQPTKTSSFSKQIKQQIVAARPVTTSSSSTSSTSSSSNLAGGINQSFGGGGFSSNLQQEKVDFSQPAQIESQFGFVPITTGSSSSAFESSQQALGFDSADAQQKSIQQFGIGDDLSGGLTAASINNKWYIMRPVENPSALGLGDARAASGSMRRVTVTRAAMAAAAGESLPAPVVVSGTSANNNNKENFEQQ